MKTKTTTTTTKRTAAETELYVSRILSGWTWQEAAAGKKNDGWGGLPACIVCRGGR